jgi:hypothetical protein
LIGIATDSHDDKYAYWNNLLPIKSYLMLSVEGLSHALASSRRLFETINTRPGFSLSFGTWLHLTHRLCAAHRPFKDSRVARRVFFLPVDGAGLEDVDRLRRYRSLSISGGTGEA